jgi:hypothetical protein
MARFVVKDLMISSLGAEDELDMPGCGPGSHCPSCSVVTCLPSCANNSCVTTLGGHLGVTPLINPASPEQLEVLKRQLSAQLRQVETHQEALRTRMRPQTVEQVEALERQLHESLAELQDMKAKLQQSQDT